MKKLILAVLISITSIPVFAQMRIKREKNAQDTAQQISTEHQIDSVRVNRMHSMDVAKSFIRDLANTDIALDIILSKYVITNDADDEMYDYLLASLAEIRLNMMSKRIQDIQFIPFQEMSRRDVSDIDTEGLNTADMVFLRHGKRQLTALYMENGKVASFTLVSKGGNKAHFVTY